MHINGIQIAVNGINGMMIQHHSLAGMMIGVMFVGMYSSISMRRFSQWFCSLLQSFVRQIISNPIRTKQFSTDTTFLSK
jgi:hypothetical protein